MRDGQPRQTRATQVSPSNLAVVEPRSRSLPSRSSFPSIGEQVERYMVLSRLGEGGMGVVFAAYDEQLERKVALKFLVRRVPTAAAQQRLRREAQALARVSHPNVVTVYEVGEHRGRIFLAMEFVHGQTLREWLELEPRAWREILAVFTDAGRGLAAAHAAQLVHRDFKGDNVMVDEAGRVRVMDFGLARRGGEQDGEELSSSAREQAQGEREGERVREPSTLDLKLTQTGTWMGTPGYISPEVYAGEAADHRADQFAFCVALLGALYGERPEIGPQWHEDALERWLDVHAHGGGKVPPWLTRVVARGLERRPTARYPSMDALLSALERDPMRRLRVGATMAGALVLAAGIGGALVLGVQQREASCGQVDRELDGVWDAERRERVEASLRATELAYAEETWTRVSEGLDRYTQTWLGARVEVCEATRARLESDTLLDLRVACLDARLGAVEALVDVFEQATPVTVLGAALAVHQLPALEACADSEALLRDDDRPADPARAQAVSELVARERELRTRMDLLGHEAVTTDAEQLLVDARALGHVPTIARALNFRGDLHDQVDEYVRSEELFVRAYTLALEAGSLSVAGHAAISMIRDWRGSGRAERLRWVERADVLSTIVEEPVMRARLLRVRAGIEHERGEFAAAQAKLEAAVALLDGAGPVTRAMTMERLAAVLTSQGEFEQAGLYFEHALGVYAREIGPNHPVRARGLATYGTMLMLAGSFERAGAMLEESLSIMRRNQPPGSSDILGVELSLGSLALLRGDYARARARYEAVLPRMEARHGPDSREVAFTLGNLGETARNQGRYAEALALQQRTLALLEGALGPEYPGLILVLTELGLDAEALGDYAQARAALERAHALIGNERGDVLESGTARFALARVLWVLDERERAQQLAGQAAFEFRAAGERGLEPLAELELWLGERPLSP